MVRYLRHPVPSDGADTVEVAIAFEGTRTARVTFRIKESVKTRVLHGVPACGLRFGPRPESNQASPCDFVHPASAKVFLSWKLGSPRRLY